MATSQAPMEPGLKERFFRYFQHEVTALQEQMERLNQMSVSGGERNDAVDHCLAGIDRLSHEVKDASGYIPTYDQRTYGEAIKALSEKLQNIRNSFNPPKKFQFKTRRPPSAIPRNGAAELAQSPQPHAPVSASDTSNTNSSIAPTPLDKLLPGEDNRQKEATLNNIEEDGLDGIDSGTGIRRPSFSNATKVTISKHEGLHIILPTSASHATSSGTVANLRRCIVDLSPPTANGAPFAALYLKNIKDSLIICGQVDGAIHITDIENSVIVTSCRQFRMHGSKNMDIYLHCASRPIFEDCEGLRFAPLPDAYMTPETLQSPNQWDQIDDFKWLKAEPSPHFTILPEAQRVQDTVWRDVVPGEHEVSLDDILKAVIVR
ncbi:tubulin-specific chaperone c [Cucurbitaria berberidis CBS 394.84]|uniref:Tubulin-specific chaperone c n=1 Tax=Cucurbitaria berberidis CBS 394.84 TaxID=1168544 RepID=A0A9P4L745_9PLEO|nr:tubulin-specific chaperone c [Cucurbitaria berberidis CBS 394.84]KAF1843758.1 tubulin-specific chaperone c [Cucurbitaria berberidis CBS 394.84]